tara:strand:+ start:81 stop:599 length:519 start_codon:yes stop_codon:yes gene_type:complete
MINVDVLVFDDFIDTVDVVFIKKSVEIINDGLDLDEDVWVEIVVVDQNTSKDLNKKFRDIDSSTDVLSFPVDRSYVNKDFKDIFVGRNYIGEVVISYQDVKEQAASKCYSIKFEMAHVIMHGILHLLGYNHDNSCGSEEFIKLEENIMSEVVELFGLKKTDQLKMHLDGGNN